MEPEAFEVIMIRLKNKHKLLKKRPGNKYPQKQLLVSLLFNYLLIVTAKDFKPGCLCFSFFKGFCDLGILN